MENESETCAVCSIPYDSKDHTPRVLINCGHTLCSSCLTTIISTKGLRKCPFDNNAFKRTQKILDHFPTNYALLAVLEGKNQNLCQDHQKKLTVLCLQENLKICPDCVGGHKGHSMKKIEDLKAKGIKVKKGLEEGLMRLEKNSKEVEISKRKCLGKMDQRFGEINKLLKARKLDWKKRAESLFETKIDSQLKEEASKTIEEITEACQKEENLASLDRDFSSITSRLLKAQGSNREISHLTDETFKMIDRLRSVLMSQASSTKSFDLPGRKVNQKSQQIPPKTVMHRLPKDAYTTFKTMFTVDKSEETLLISVKDPNPVDRMINITALNKMKRIQVMIERYDSLSQGSPDFNFLSYIFQNFNNYTSLIVSFAPEGLTDHHALCLFNILFCQIQHLVDIEICLKGCQIINDPILFLCNSLLTRATSLKYLTLKLGSTLISDLSLFALAKSLSPFRENLRSLTLIAENTAITDNGIEKICIGIRGVKALRLYLEGTEITDCCLKVLGDDVMPEMKNLEQLSLDVSKTKITIEGVGAIFTGIPKDISRLSLSFEGIKLSDEVVSLFEKKVCPKLEVVEDVHLRLEGNDLKAKAGRVLERVRKEAEERRKVYEYKQERN